MIEPNNNPKTISLILEGENIKARSVIKILTAFIELTEKSIKSVAKSDGVRIELDTFLDVEKIEKGFRFELYWDKK